MGKPEPDPFPEPFPEPEKPWPIDPRPAIREAKELLADSPPWRTPSPHLRKWTALAVFSGFVLLGWSRWSDRILHPPPPRNYISYESLLQIQKGMSQKDVREILGDPPGEKPDCWSYNFSNEQFVRIHFGSMFKVTEVERVNKRLHDSNR